MRYYVIYLLIMNLLQRNIDQISAAAIARQQTNKEQVMYIATLIRSFSAWRRYCTAVRELASLDDRALRDIGLNRTQIKQAAWGGR